MASMNNNNGVMAAKWHHAMAAKWQR